MAEEQENEETGDLEESGAEGGEKKSRLPSKKVMIIAGAALLVVAGGGGAMFFLDPFGLFAGDKNKEAAQAEQSKKKAVNYGYYDLPEMVVNLSSENGRKHFLKVNVTLQLQSKIMIALMKPYQPALMDAFQGYLRELRMGDLEGSGGLFRLKSELLKRVNTTVYPQKAEAVLFKQIIVQ